MNCRIKSLILVLATAALTACGSSDSPHTEQSIDISDGPISHKNFEMAFDPADPEVIDDDGFHSGVEVTITVNVGDRHNVAVGDGTIHFRTQWGILNADSCKIVNGSCSVTWVSDANFAFLPLDNVTSIVAYTYGEEAFLDLNGNGVFDDADGGLFVDMDEPYIDTNHDYVYDAFDELIDINSDGIHNDGDSMFNGVNCTHSTLCGSGTPTRVVIYDISNLNLDQSGAGAATDTPPTVTITAPADAADLTAGGFFTFTVDANDAEDGAIVDTDNPVGTIISWDSDQTVPGTGFSTIATSSIDTTGWDVGVHTITVTVTDTDGNSVTDSITITR